MRMQTHIYIYHTKTLVSPPYISLSLHRDLQHSLPIYNRTTNLQVTQLIPF